ncbi:MAG TPA: hypothetical protein VGA19_03090 [Rhodospirillales bacterium]
MQTMIKRFAFLVLPVALLLAACETAAPVQKLPEITFGHLPPIKLNVAKIEVVSRYQPPMKAPNVDHLFPTPPLAAIRKWAADRLRAVGSSGTAQLVIDDASIIETPLERKKGFTATFTKQQEARYDLKAEVSLDVADGIKRGRAAARAARFVTTREDVTLNQRDRIWFEQTELLMNEFNAEMEKNIRQYLGAWLR